MVKVHRRVRFQKYLINFETPFYILQAVDTVYGFDYFVAFSLV